MEIALVVLSILTLSFMIAYIAISKKLNELSINFADIVIKNLALQEAVKNQEIPQSDKEIHKENFIKFLSDSRDWAFDYIEESQKTIKQISEELKNQGLNKYSEKLMSLLPEIKKKK